jgi:RNA polymerase sigma-70 factor (ECF subfamily)
MARVTRKEEALDGFLVASARLGDRRAFEQLVIRWDAKLRAHAWRLLGDAEQAREATQDGWAEIVRGLARLQDGAAFPAWAYRIVSRRCARVIKGNQDRRRLSAELETEPRGSQEDGADNDRLRAAVRLLPPDQRAAVALYHFEELSIAETAVALDVPAGTVKTRLMHARRKLRAALEGE